MAKGYLDGFCVGEPWNTLAMQRSAGTIVALTTDLAPAHPDKVLAVRRAVLESKRRSLGLLVRGCLCACAFCEKPENRFAVAKMLAGKAYLDLPVEVIDASLSIDERSRRSDRAPHRPADWHMRSIAPASVRPSVAHARWLLDQMYRWNEIAPDVDRDRIARRATETEVFEEVEQP